MAWPEKLRTIFTSQFLVIFLLVLAGIPVIEAAQEADVKRGNITGSQNFDIPDWFKPSFLEIAEDVAESGQENKHVILFFHLDACPYCDQLLTDNFVDAAEDSFIRSNFDAIEINIKGDRIVEFNDSLSLTEKELAEHLEVKYTPTVLFIDGSNETVLRTNGYRGRERFQHALQFVKQGLYKNQTLNDYIAAMDTSADGIYQLRPNPVFIESRNLQAESEQPLMVILEDRACSDCASFHDDLLSRADVKASLGEIKVVRLDTDSTEPITDVDGNQTSAKDWARSLQVDYRPAVLFFDKNREIVRVDNRLWSWNFTGIISWVAGRHYDKYPDMYEYMGELREKRLAAGDDVNFRDD